MSGAYDRLPVSYQDQYNQTQHGQLSMYGLIRATQSRETMNEAAYKAVVAFWVSWLSFVLRHS
jgi:hypothetical protein